MMLCVKPAVTIYGFSSNDGLDDNVPAGDRISLCMTDVSNHCAVYLTIMPGDLIHETVPCSDINNERQDEITATPQDYYYSAVLGL